MPCVLLFVHGLNQVLRGVRTISLGEFENGHEATMSNASTNPPPPKKCAAGPRTDDTRPPRRLPSRVGRARYIITPGELATPGSWPFETERDARWVLDALGKRLGRYGLVLHPTKTRFVDFRPKRP